MSGFTTGTKTVIVVFTHDRPAFVRRQILYWRDTGIKLLLMDNGLQPAVQRPESLPANIMYEYDRDAFSIQIGKASEIVDDYDFSMLCDDDGIVLKSGLSACESLLQKHTGVQVVVGEHFQFHVRNARPEVEIRNDHRFGVNTLNLNQEERIYHNLVPYRGLFYYAFFRARLHSRLLRDLSSIRSASSCPYATEVFLELSAAAQTPTLSAQRMLIGRSRENPPVTDRVRTRSLTFADWAINTMYSLEFEEWLNAVAKYVDFDRLRLASVVDDFVQAEIDAGRVTHPGHGARIQRYLRHRLRLREERNHSRNADYVSIGEGRSIRLSRSLSPETNSVRQALTTQRKDFNEVWTMLEDSARCTA